MDDDTLNKEEMLDSADNFEAAYKAHSKSIRRFLLWQTKDSQLSEDLASITFEKAWISRSSFKGGSEQAWLYRIARNVLIDYWRKNKDLNVENIESLDEGTKVNFGELLDKKTQAENLRQALAKLPSDMQAVINLRFVEAMSCKQVAKELKISESNVRVIQYRALKKLRGYIK